jgi:hypothetical protein
MMMSNPEQKCSVCCNPAKVEYLGRNDGFQVICEVCGTYMVDGSLFASIKSVMDSIEPWKISCAIRMRSDKSSSGVFIPRIR